MRICTSYNTTNYFISEITTTSKYFFSPSEKGYKHHKANICNETWMRIQPLDKFHALIISRWITLFILNFFHCLHMWLLHTIIYFHISFFTEFQYKKEHVQNEIRDKKHEYKYTTQNKNVVVLMLTIASVSVIKCISMMK